jgi:hypothetical protein
MADGPIHFADTLTSSDNQALNIENMTRFGRSFSVVRVPYAFKLLMQELQAMNVQMRVLTEDNIDQIASMSFSTLSLDLGGADNLIRENKAAVGAKIPIVPVSPKADNRPALRPAKEGANEGAEEEEQGAEKAESLGWHFVNFEANGGEIYQSLIRDEKGAPTQMWSVQQHGGKYPTEHPEGWNAQMLYYNDGVPIKAEAVVDLLKQMPYANNFALAVQDIRDQQAMSEADRSEAERKDADAIPIPELVLPMSPMYEPSSPAYTPMYEPTSPLQMQQQQGGGIQQPIMQPMMMMPQQQMMPQMMMMPQLQMMMMPQQPMMMMAPHPTSVTVTGAKAAELIEEQLHPSTTSESASVSILDVAPEVKPAESSSASSESSGSSEGKRVIKLS